MSRPLIPRRGELGAEYVFDLTDVIERQNCNRGCIHAGWDGEFVTCAKGLIGEVIGHEGEEVPQFLVTGRKTVECIERVDPNTPWTQGGPDLFGGAA